MKGNFNIDLWIERILNSRFFFLIIGCTTVCLKAPVAQPDHKEVFNKCKIQGSDVKNFHKKILDQKGLKLKTIFFKTEQEQVENLAGSDWFKSGC